MENIFERTEMLLGKDAMQKLQKSHITLFGLGGVGSAAAEALVRSGVGNFTFIDPDAISETNINRQLMADTTTIGQPKACALLSKMKKINPDVNIDIKIGFYLPGMESDFIPEKTDLIIDAIDTISSKISLAVFSAEQNIPILSCMGTGNKLDPSRLRAADIYETKVCPLAKVMRRELRKRGIKSLKVVFSDEEPLKPFFEANDKTKRQTPGSCAFVPNSAGLLLASLAVKTLIQEL